MRWSMARLLSLLGFVFTMRFVGSAYAQAPPDEVAAEPARESTRARDSASNRAEELFHQAESARRELRMSDARALLSESLALDPHAPTAYNLALVLVEMGVYSAATRVADELLEGRYGPLGEAQSAAVTRLRTEARAGLAELQVRSDASFALELLVDGELVGGLEPGATRLHLLDPGPHSVLALGERGRLIRRVSSSSGERVALRIADEDFAPQPEMEEEREVHDEAGRRSPWLWVALGALAVTAGVTVAVLATRTSDTGSTLPVRFLLSENP